MPITADLFRAALGRFASGVTVVTTVDASGRPDGLTVSAFASVSLDPPLIVVAIDKANASVSAMTHTGRFNVHVLSASQESLSRRFSDASDPFAGIQFSRDAAGLPRLPGALSVLTCHVETSIDAGDHFLFLGRVESIDVAEGEPLLYFRGDYRRIEGAGG